MHESLYLSHNCGQQWWHARGMMMHCCPWDGRRATLSMRSQPRPQNPHSRGTVWALPAVAQGPIVVKHAA